MCQYLETIILILYWRQILLVIVLQQIQKGIEWSFSFYRIILIQCPFLFVPSTSLVKKKVSPLLYVAQTPR